MNKYTMTAKCVAVEPVQSIGQKGFKKRTFVLCENPAAEYPNFLAWELKRDNVEMVNSQMIGATLTVEGYPESRAWDDPKTRKKRFFTSMTAIKVALAEQKESAKEAIPPESIAEEEPVTEDLPF